MVVPEGRFKRYMSPGVPVSQQQSTSLGVPVIRLLKLTVFLREGLEGSERKFRLDRESVSNEREARGPWYRDRVCGPVCHLSNPCANPAMATESIPTESGRSRDAAFYTQLPSADSCHSPAPWVPLQLRPRCNCVMPIIIIPETELHCEATSILAGVHRSQFWT